MDVLEQEAFENRCMDVIESIVRLDEQQDRAGAIAVARKLLEKARKKEAKKAIDVYERVIYEFQIATDDEYNDLRSQIFE